MAQKIKPNVGQSVYVVDVQKVKEDGDGKHARLVITEWRCVSYDDKTIAGTNAQIGYIQFAPIENASDTLAGARERLTQLTQEMQAQGYKISQ